MKGYPLSPSSAILILFKRFRRSWVVSNLDAAATIASLVIEVCSHKRPRHTGAYFLCLRTRRVRNIESLYSISYFFITRMCIAHFWRRNGKLPLLLEVTSKPLVSIRFYGHLSNMTDESQKSAPVCQRPKVLQR